MTLSVLCFGEIVTDLIDTGNSTLVCKVGGAPLNVAVALRRLGEKSTFVSSVGDDWFGANALSYLKTNHVSYLAETVPATPTRTAIVFHDRNGERGFQFSRGVAAENAMSRRQLEIIGSSRFDVVHFGSFPFARGQSLSSFKRFVGRARKSGTSAVFDPNVRLGVFDSPDDARRICRELAGVSDVIRLNIDELSFLTRSKALSGKTKTIERAAATLSDLGPETIFVTDGGRGSYAYIGGRLEYKCGFKVRAVDTTGCGDAFTAALISRYFSKRKTDAIPDGELLRWANATGALAATKLGGADSMPTRVQVEHFVKSHSRGGDQREKKDLLCGTSRRFKSNGRIT